MKNQTFPPDTILVVLLKFSVYLLKSKLQIYLIWSPVICGWISPAWYHWYPCRHLSREAMWSGVSCLKKQCDDRAMSWVLNLPKSDIPTGATPHYCCPNEIHDCCTETTQQSNFWSQQNSLITLWVSFICRTCLSRQRTSPGCWQLWYCTWEECLPYLSLLWDFKWPNRVETRGTIIFQLNVFSKNEIFTLYLNSKFVIFNHCECSSQKLCCKQVAGFSMGHCKQFFVEMFYIDWAFY